MKRTLMILALLLSSCAEEVVEPGECGFAELEEHVVVENRDDQVGPGQVALRDVIVSRGYRSAFGVRTACDDRALMSVVLLVPEDDVSAKENLGFRLREASPLPEGLVLPEIVRANDGVIDVLWFDRAEQNQEGFEFDLQVAAVDEAGNFGAFSAPFRVSDRGNNSRLHFYGAHALVCGAILLSILAKKSFELFHAFCFEIAKPRLKLNKWAEFWRLPRTLI